MACCGRSCWLSAAAVAVLVAVVLLERRPFLLCMNATFYVLNYLDGTPRGKTLNPYTGTAAEEFTRPLRQQEIGRFLDIPVTSGKIPAAVTPSLFYLFIL